jgi:hypothetical protein
MGLILPVSYFQKKIIVSGGGYDPDAQAFITATGISGTEATAINQFVLDLKSYSLWNQFNVIYPLVGASAVPCSYNLINTLTYQITWNGTVSFASTGVTGNGTTGWGNTFLNPNASGLFTSGMSLSAYIRTEGNSAAYDIGSNNYPTQAPTSENMIARFDNDRYTAFGDVAPGNPYIISNGADHLGLFVGTSDTSTTYLYLDGSLLTSSSKTYGTANNNIAVCALGRPSGTASDFSSREYALFSIGQYLNSTQNTNFNNCVTTFETTLGRNV